MKIHLLSDLHLEWGSYTPAKVEADVVVLAGDTWHPGKKERTARGVAWAAEHFTGVPVLYGLGNHCYYGTNIIRAERKYREASEGTNVHVLQCDERRIGDVRFLGATLWTDFALHGDARSAMLAAEDPYRGMNDYSRIRTGPTMHKLRATETLAIHKRQLLWLKERLEEDPAVPTVIVTHHAPSGRSLKPGTEKDLLSPAYASELEDLLMLGNVRLWAHGHTHWPVDYWLGNTRVVSNPRGYAELPVDGFDPGLVLEL